MDVLRVLIVFAVTVCIITIAVGIVMLIVRLVKLNATLDELLRVLAEKASGVSAVEEQAEATVNETVEPSPAEVKEVPQEEKLAENVPEVTEKIPVAEESVVEEKVPVAEEPVVEEKIVLKPLLVEEQEAAAASVAPEAMPREPSPFERRLMALKNWFIYGRTEGAGEDGSKEKMIATTWLLRSGILVLLFSSAFLLKLSIERGLLGPEGRVAISYLCGAALLFAGLHRKMRENYWSLGQALAGIGLGTLYFSSFAMTSMYSLTPVYVGFAVMVLVTLTAGFIADKLTSLPIAMVSLIGGYATPLMLSTGQKNIPGLAGYLLLLGCGVLWLSSRRNWLQLNILGIIFTYGIFLLVFNKQFETGDFAAYQTGLVLFMLLFSISVFIYNVRKRIPASEVEIIGLLLNSGIFFAESMLAIRRVWPDERLMAAPLTLGLSMLYLFHTLFFSKLKRAEYRNLLLIFCALSALFLSLTFPAVLSGHWLGAAWALEALVLLWLSAKMESAFLRGCSWLLYFCTLMRLLAYEFLFYGKHLPWNDGEGFWASCIARSCQFLIPVICLALGAKMTLKQKGTQALEETEDREEKQPDLSCASLASGVFFTLAFLLCFVFLRLELAVILDYSLPSFALAGVNLAWVGGLILALLLLNSNVPGWWKWIFSIVAPFFLFCCIVDFFDDKLWRWSCIYGSIFNTLLLTLGIWYASRKLRSRHFPTQVAMWSSIIWPVLLFIHGTREVHAIVENKLPGMSGGGVSLLWAVFAFVLVMNGLRRSSKIARYIGLALFAVVVAKVFFYDISNLDAVYRVMAFLAFGILLLGAAFVYIKFWGSKEEQQ